MKKMLALSLELIGYNLVALFLGKELDSYFQLKGWGLFGFFILAYVIWFYQIYKVFKQNEKV